MNAPASASGTSKVTWNQASPADFFRILSQIVIISGCSKGFRINLFALESASKIAPIFDSDVAGEALSFDSTFLEIERGKGYATSNPRICCRLMIFFVCTQILYVYYVYIYICVCSCVNLSAHKKFTLQIRRPPNRKVIGK